MSNTKIGPPDKVLKVIVFMRAMTLNDWHRFVAYRSIAPDSNCGGHGGHQRPGARVQGTTRDHSGRV